jgi:hypothetical protein
MVRRSVLFAVALLAGLGAARPRAQQPALEAILARAAEYTTHYMDALSHLVAEERDIQDLFGIQPLVRGSDPYYPSDITGTTTQRELRSDVVLVRVGPPVEWRTYRDVFEVDGRPVRDRNDRIVKLILQPATTAHAQAERIAEESARFNLSTMGRTLNEPGLPLVFLQAALQPRFHFALDKRDGSVGAHVWVVKYEERARPTLFRHNNRIDNPSAGRFWIDEVTGEVARTEHLVAPPGLTAAFTTRFRHDDRFGVSVPIDMHERLSDGVQAGSHTVDGTAKYSNYRRFEVSTEDKIR